jgi:competence protein ComEC
MIHNSFNSNAKIFRYFLLCFVIGTAIASFLFVEFFWLYLLGLIAMVLAVLFWPKNFWRIIFLGGIIIILGIFRYQLSLPKIDETKVWFYNGQRIDFQGIIIKEPDVRINHTKLTVQATGKITGKVLVSVGLYPEYQYGDLVSVYCQLKAPEPFDGFAYDRYLAKDNIYSQCSYPRVKLISRHNGDWLLTKIYQFKNKLKQTINSNLPEPQASLFSAITLGVRRGVPKNLSDKFSITGTSHLIAISGLHITIITVILMKIALGCYLSRKKAFWVITIALLVYVTMIGFPASAVRASLMGWLAMLAMYLGRLNRSTNALIFVASLMILVSPKILRDDIGFQLSFSAVLGLIYLSPLFEAKLAKLPSYLGLKESLQMTISAQIATMPLIVYNFGRLSLIGPVVNLLVLPVLPYLMIIGFAALFLSLVFPGTQYLFWPVWLILTYLIKVIEIFAAIPRAALNFD